MNVTRALSRLKSVFVTLIGSFKATNPADVKNIALRDWNNFYSPMRTYSESVLNQFDSNGEFEAQLQIGSKLYPEYPIRSHAEAYSQLVKTLGLSSTKFNNVDVNSHEYRTIKFVWATDMEKVIEARFTGYNSKMGDILNLSFTHRDTTAANWATGVHVILHADCIMEIRDSGVEVSM